MTCLLGVHISRLCRSLADFSTDFDLFSKSSAFYIKRKPYLCLSVVGFTWFFVMALVLALCF